MLGPAKGIATAGSQGSAPDTTHTNPLPDKPKGNLHAIHRVKTWAHYHQGSWKFKGVLLHIIKKWIWSHEITRTSSMGLTGRGFSPSCNVFDTCLWMGWITVCIDSFRNLETSSGKGTSTYKAQRSVIWFLSLMLKCWLNSLSPEHEMCWKRISRQIFVPSGSTAEGSMRNQSQSYFFNHILESNFDN